jgi:hypothetical protein
VLIVPRRLAARLFPGQATLTWTAASAYPRIYPVRLGGIQMSKNMASRFASSGRPRHVGKVEELKADFWERMSG